MKNKIAGIAMKTQLSVAALLLASAASAQTTTLEYEGELMTGTVTSLAPGMTITTGLASAAFNEAFTAEVILQGSLQTGLKFVSYDIKMGGQDFSSLSASGLGVRLLGDGNGGFSSYGGPPIESLTISSDHGNITGAVFSFSYDIYHGNNINWNVGGAIDSYYYQPDFGPWGSGTCENGLSVDGKPYTGPSVSPCKISTASVEAGTWEVDSVTRAPEIDPASAASGLALLFGGVAVLRGRRRIQH